MAKVRKEYDPFDSFDGLGYSGLSLAEIFGEDKVTMPGQRAGFIPIDEFPNEFGMTSFGLTPEEQLIFREEMGRVEVAEEMTVEEVRSIMLR